MFQTLALPYCALCSNTQTLLDQYLHEVKFFATINLPE